MGAKELFASEEAMNDPFKDMNFEVTNQADNIIKVIGVGGGGGNAIKNMVQEGFKNVTFAVVNTDAQALQKATVPTKVLIGDSGLGVGGVPERGREAAEKSIEKIKSLFDDNTKMVFITAGMGGGTGTGASPVIAREARERGILTVGVVTLPFGFEKSKRIEKALLGAKELKENVDSLLVINNQRLMEIYDDEMTTVEEAFNKADNVITVATRSIAEIITIEGKVNRDFCDVQTVMKDGGSAILSSGHAKGEHRIIKAMKEALTSPLLNKAEIQKSHKILYIMYQSHASQMKITELNEINAFMDNMAPDLEVLWGLYWDDSLGDEVRVDIVATGFDKPHTDATNKDDENAKTITSMYEHYYTDKGTRTPSISDQMEATINNNVKILDINSGKDKKEDNSDEYESSDESVKGQQQAIVFPADDNQTLSGVTISFDDEEETTDGPSASCESGNADSPSAISEDTCPTANNTVNGNAEDNTANVSNVASSTASSVNGPCENDTESINTTVAFDFSKDEDDAAEPTATFTPSEGTIINSNSSKHSPTTTGRSIFERIKKKMIDIINEE